VILELALRALKLGGIGATLSGSQSPGLDEANFAGMDLRGRWFSGMSFEGASFRDADLAGATFTDNTFGDTDFRGACLRNAAFSGFAWRGDPPFDIDFRGADLRGALFTDLPQTPVDVATRGSEDLVDLATFLNGESEITIITDNSTRM
jgi:uncharacterized protein YjbI with pentapeptide repeats